MKKGLLFLASLVMSLAASAQWTKPTPTTVDMADDGETTQYLYNKEAVGFFAGANDWGTRASIAPTGDPVRMKALESGTWNLGCYPSTKSAWLYVSCNDWNAMWVDASNDVENESYPGTDQWVVAKQANGSYKFTNKSCDADPGTLGVAEIFEGKTGNTRLFIKDSKAEYTFDENGEEASAPSFSGEFYDEWVFITEEEYEAIQPKVAQYTAAVSLKAALDAAKAENPSLDFSAPEAVYNKVSSTAEELAAAEAQVQAIVNDYKSSLASFDEPYDYTDIIGDGSDVSPWTRTFTGSGTSGSHSTNTWSTEADGGADGTDMTTPFCEHWVASGGILSDQKIYQTLSALPPGLYKFTADVRVYSEAGKLDQFEGAYMYFGDEKIDMQDETDISYSGSKSVLWSKNYFTIIAILKESGDVEFGFEIKDANFNWIAFKNTSLFYYGNKDVEANAAKLLKAGYSFEKSATDVAANADVIKAYNDAVDAFNAATSAEDIKATAKAAEAAESALEANIEAYKKLYNKFNEWDENLASHSTLVGPDWDDFSDFIQSESEIEGYPTPVPTVIKEENNYPLTTAEIEEYIHTVDSLYAHAVATSLVPGTDCTSMLVNADFGSSTSIDGAAGTYNTDGWTGSAALGGLNDYMTAERYSTTVDFYQTVKDAPAGIYKIETHAFVRPAANGSYDGSEEIACWLYMNNFRTAVQHILTDAIPVDQAVDQENCYLSAAASGTFWPASTWSTGYDYNYTGTELPNGTYSASGFYVPNCMVGASVAFKAGRYPVTTYGLVGDGEDMKIGITSDGSDVHWFLFSGFKLTYMGKDATAIAAVLPTYVSNLQDYLDAHSTDMTSPVLTAAQKIADDAAAMKASDPAEDLWDALQNVNQALVDAQANVEAVTALNTAKDKLDETINAYEEQATEEAKQQYYAVVEKADDYEGLATDEVNALVEEINVVIAALKVPDFSDASDENPINFTGLIYNPSYEDATCDGWEGSTKSLSGLNRTDMVEYWHASFDHYQTIYNLPAGTYELTVNGYNRYADNATTDYGVLTAGTKDETQTAVVYVTIGENTKEVPFRLISEGARTATDVVSSSYSTIETDEGDVYTPNNMQAAGACFEETDEDGNPLSDEQNYVNRIIFTLSEAGDITIGCKNSVSDSWCIWDNWTLTYYGPNSNRDTAVKSIATATAAPAAIYTITGAKVATLQKGINIVRLSDGTVKKVLVK